MKLLQRLTSPTPKLWRQIGNALLIQKSNEHTSTTNKNRSNS
jgi:hypothetical protein